MNSIPSIKSLLRAVHLEDLGRHLFHWARRLHRRALGIDRDLIQDYLSATSVRKLHIGCGDRRLPGWLNSDFLPWRRDILQLDAARVFPLADGQFDYAFSEHMIEHIPYEAGLNMLRECHRVLKPGGRLRIATPNLEFLIDMYTEPKTELQVSYLHWARKSFTPHAPEQSDTFVINNFFRAWDHQFIYDEKTLRYALEVAGFANVERFPVNVSDTGDLAGLECEENLPPGFYRLETMVLEGRKLS
jgi:predicted SAM-dependent methyltransferase